MSAWVPSVEISVRRTVLVLALVACGCSNRPDSNRVSVVLVTIDTLRADYVGCYGGDIPTPHLDQVAGEGSVFLDATAHSPLTLPSHSSILTGTTPIYHGVKDNGRYRLPDEIDTLAEILKGAGYSTAAFVGALPVHSRFGLSQGFEVYDENFVDERRAADVTTSAREWMEQQGSKLSSCGYISSILTRPISLRSLSVLNTGILTEARSLISTMPWVLCSRRQETTRSRSLPRTTAKASASTERTLMHFSSTRARCGSH